MASRLQLAASKRLTDASFVKAALMKVKAVEPDTRFILV
jgi:hypothetical protein